VIDQSHEVGVPVEVSVNVTVRGASPERGVAVKEATGGGYDLTYGMCPTYPILKLLSAQRIPIQYQSFGQYPTVIVKVSAED
jgi:hypothetical protein